MKVFFCATFHLCENNSYSGTQIYEFFKRNGYELVRKSSEADIIVINTCGFDLARENEAAAIIEHYIRRYRGRKEIIISGCLPKIRPELEKTAGVTTIGPRELSRFNERFRPRIPIEAVKANELNKGLASPLFGFPDDYYVQICQGCVNACSYCAIKKAKGAVRSKPPDEVLAEIEEGLRRGRRRIVLLADDCGSYGADLKTDFAELLNRINRLEGDFKLNIHYWEPRRLLKLFPKIDDRVYGKIYFMNVPIQSVSPKLLRMMNRRYALPDVLKTVSRIKALGPDIHIQTHILYGFPSESRREFRDTFKLAEYFDTVVYFYYTPKRGTVSAEFKGGIHRTEVLHRTYPVIQSEAEIGNTSRWQVSYTSDYPTDVFKAIRRDVPLGRLDALLLQPEERGAEAAVPLGLLTAAQPLVERGFGVEALDARLEEDAAARMRALKSECLPALAAIECERESQLNGALGLASRAKTELGVPVALWGAHAASLGDGALAKEGVDHVLREPPGPALIRLLERLRKGRAPEEKGRESALEDDPPYWLVIDYFDRYARGALRTDEPGRTGAAAKKSPGRLLRQVKHLLVFMRRRKAVDFLGKGFVSDRKRLRKFLSLLREEFSKGDSESLGRFEWTAECSPAVEKRLPPSLSAEMAGLGLSRLKS